MPDGFYPGGNAKLCTMCTPFFPSALFRLALQISPLNGELGLAYIRFGIRPAR